MTGGRPSRGARSGVASGAASGAVSAAGVCSGGGVGSVLSCRPPSCRSSSVGPPAGRAARAGGPGSAGRRPAGGTDVRESRCRCGRRDPAGALRAAADPPRCRAPRARRCRCRSRSVSSAVHEARISTSTVCSGPARSPNRVEAVRVTVPPTLWCVGAGVGQRVGEPAPGDLGEHGVVDQFLVGGRRQVADAAGGAVPGLVPVGVEQHDEPGAGDLEVVVVAASGSATRAPTACAHGRAAAVRGCARGRSPGRARTRGQGVQGGAERGGRFVPARVPASVPGAGQAGGLHVRRVGRRLAHRARRAARIRVRVSPDARSGRPPAVWEDGRS